MLGIIRNTRTVKTVISTYWILFGLFWLESVLVSDDALQIKLTISLFLGVVPLLMGWWLAVEAQLFKGPWFDLKS